MHLRSVLEEKQGASEEATGSGWRQSTVTDMALANLPTRLRVGYKNTASEYENGADELLKAANRMESALENLLATERMTSEKAKAAVSRAKDSAAQLGDALAKVERLLGRDFESRLSQLERLAGALSNLADLNRSGQLTDILKALSSK